MLNLSRSKGRETLRSAISRNKRPATISSVASARADQPVPATRIPRELSEWACHEELGQALVAGDETRVMELSSRLSDGAAKMSELMGVMVPWCSSRGGVTPRTTVVPPISKSPRWCFMQGYNCRVTTFHIPGFAWCSHGGRQGGSAITEVESEASDPEERVDSVVNALQHDLEGRTPNPIVDLSSSTPKRSPMVRYIPDEVDDDHLIRPTNGRFVVPRLEHVSVDVSSQVAGIQDWRLVPLFQLPL